MIISRISTYTISSFTYHEERRHLFRLVQSAPPVFFMINEVRIPLQLHSIVTMPFSFYRKFKTVETFQNFNVLVKDWNIWKLLEAINASKSEFIINGIRKNGWPNSSSNMAVLTFFYQQRIFLKLDFFCSMLYS